jgi:hypothetical protein
MTSPFSNSDSLIYSVLSVKVDGQGEQEVLFIYLIINMFARINCPPCLIFLWVSSTHIDNQLLTKTFCSPPGGSWEKFVFMNVILRLLQHGVWLAVAESCAHIEMKIL